MAEPAGSGAPAPARSSTDLPESSQRLLQAGIDAFAERGYDATTTRDIAARVGMSPAALYVHFPSKAALLAAISLAGHQAVLTLTERAIADGADPVARLRAVVASFASWHAENHRMARVVQHELAALPAEQRHGVIRLRHRIEDLLAEQVRAGVGLGVMVVPDVAAVARAVLSLGVDVARWYDPGKHEPPEQIGELYAELAARMVGAVQPAATNAVGPTAKDR